MHDWIRVSIIYHDFDEFWNKLFRNKLKLVQMRLWHCMSREPHVNWPAALSANEQIKLTTLRKYFSRTFHQTALNESRFYNMYLKCIANTVWSRKCDHCLPDSPDSTWYWLHGGAVAHCCCDCSFDCRWPYCRNKTMWSEHLPPMTFLAPALIALYLAQHHWLTYVSAVGVDAAIPCHLFDL